MGSSPYDPESTGAAGAPPVEPHKVQAELYEALHRFSEALAIVETVSNALQAAESNLECPTVGAEIASLRQGVAALRAVHEEFDLAIPKVAS